MGKLYVGAADNLNRLNNLICLLLKTFLAFFGDGQHRCCAERVTGMHTQRINILNKAYCNHVVVFITDNLQLQFFPAENGLFNKDLTYKAGLKTSGTNGLQFFLIVNQTAAGATHCVSRTKNHRIIQLIRNVKGFLHTIGNLTSRHLNTKLIHGMLKFNTVFTTLNGIHLYTDNLHIIFVQNTGLVQLRTQIKTGLSAKIRQKGIRTFLRNNLFKTFHIQRLNIRYIRCLRVRHNRCRVGIDQYNLVTQFFQCLAGLSA